jgi:hypothetical protein
MSATSKSLRTTRKSCFCQANMKSPSDRQGTRPVRRDLELQLRCDCRKSGSRILLHYHTHDYPLPRLHYHLLTLYRIHRLRRCRSLQCLSPGPRGRDEVAETRAVNRALRKAYGIGICSLEEISSLAEPTPSSRESKKLPPQPVNGNCGGPKVRDRFCQLIRQPSGGIAAPRVVGRSGIVSA